MATGSGVQQSREIVTSDVTPNIDLDTGEARMWGALGNLAGQIAEREKVSNIRKAQEVGAREGAAAAKSTAAGQPTDAPRLPWFIGGDVVEARNQAAESAYFAGIKNDADEAERQAQRDHGYNLDAYRAQMEAVRSGFIKNAPSEYAVDVENYITGRMNLGYDAVAANVERVALAEQAKDLALRGDNLLRQMSDELETVGAITPLYESLNAEWDELRALRLGNPAIPYSEEMAVADDQRLSVSNKSALYTNLARATLRDEGGAAALQTLQGILTDDSIQPSERPVVFERVREVINREIDLETDQRNIQTAQRNRAVSEMDRRIAEDIAAVELGLADTGLTEGEVMASPGGSAAVAEWYRGRAEAAERNRLTGSLAGLPLEAATRRARAALSSSGMGTIADLSQPLKTDADFDALASAIRIVETGNNPRRTSRDPDGAGPAGGGAVGAMQLLPATAQRMAQLEGVPYDATRLLNDVDYNERLGRRYLRELLDRYDGNAVLAATAYHAGEGNVDAWLQPVGTVSTVAGKRVSGKGDPRTGDITVDEWINRIEAAGNPRSAEYPRKVARALEGGEEAAAWRDQRAQAIATNATEGFASDPLRFAASHRLGELPALFVDGAFVDDVDASRAWGEAMRARVQMGVDLAERYQVPQRIFTDGEVASYKDRFERDPASAVRFARRAMLAVGPASARQALVELGSGSDASAVVHIANLSTGGDPRFADQAALGLRFHAEGERLAKDDADDVEQALAAYAPSFRNSPVQWAAIRASARAAALADQQSGSLRSGAYYARAAVGGHTWQGRSYGGLATLNGRDTIVPRWLNPEYADEAVETLADLWTERGIGPVYGNDQPIPAREIARMRLVNQPNGRYRLVDRNGHVAMSRSGNVFELDMEAGRDFLHGRLGSRAVRPEQ